MYAVHNPLTGTLSLGNSRDGAEGGFVSVFYFAIWSPYFLLSNSSSVCC